MTAISAVFWDVGGVLLTNGWDHAGRAAVLMHFGLDKEEFESRHATVVDPWEKGLIPVADYLATAVFHEPRSFSPAEFLEQMKAQSLELADGGLGILRQMAASTEVKLAVLNNEARELNDYRLKQFGLIGLFDMFFSSCYLALRKPGLEIYRRALDIVQRPANDIAFIDDRAENVVAAVEVGMHGIQFESPEQLSRELDRLGVVLT